MFNKERLDATDHALRLVLLAALDRDEALCCLEGEGAAGACRWPSGVYTALSHAALASPWVWCRCRARLDAALADQLDLHGAASPAELAERFHDGRDVVSSRELAGMLWSLLRRPELYQESLLSRLSAEFEVAVFAGCIPGRGPATTGPSLVAH
jgi:hypothetical protein